MARHGKARPEVVVETSLFECCSDCGVEVPASLIGERHSEIQRLVDQ